MNPFHERLRAEYTAMANQSFIAAARAILGDDYVTSTTQNAYDTTALCADIIQTYNDKRASAGVVHTYSNIDVTAMRETLSQAGARLSGFIPRVEPGQFVLSLKLDTADLAEQLEGLSEQLKDILTTISERQDGEMQINFHAGQIESIYTTTSRQYV